MLVGDGLSEKNLNQLQAEENKDNIASAEFAQNAAEKEKEGDQMSK